MPEERSIHIHLALLFIVLLFGAIIVYARHVNNQRIEKQSVQALPTKFTTYVYNVSLEYPADWQPTPGYDYGRYNGSDGFFQLSAAGDLHTKIEDLVRDEVEHKLHPYGSSPTTEELKVDGEPAYLIMPSADQDRSMRDQAELVVRYPKPVTVSAQAYYYLVLWADKDHIRSIAATLKFL